MARMQSNHVLMCEKTKFTDAEIQRLCQEIVTGQRQEIAQMKAILDGFIDRAASGPIGAAS